MKPVTGNNNNFNTMKCGSDGKKKHCESGFKKVVCFDNGIYT
jgi:hypothetical protein